jgi:hypothetical protein
MYDPAPRALFDSAQSKAERRRLFARLTGKPLDLLPFEALMDALKTYQQIPHRDAEMIPLDRIIGSVGRYKDFDRSFLPRNKALSDRWIGVSRLMNGGAGVPPIEVFKVGDAYFVSDGNHRVSVARASGLPDIEAYVTEYPIDPGLEPGDSLDQALIKAGRARFLAETGLDRVVPDDEIRFTVPGGEKLLMEHIAVHRCLQRECDPAGRWPSLERAALDWYTNTYEPIVKLIRERRLLERFPGHTTADLYVQIWRFITEMCVLFDEKVSFEEGADLLELAPSQPFRRVIGEFIQRLPGAAAMKNRAP